VKRITDPLPFIRSSPQRFLRQTPATGHELATALVGDAVLLTRASTTLTRVLDGWWVVGCERDWLASDEAEADPVAAFSRMLPFPEAGPNSMRAEVLIAAFAATAITVGRGDRHVVAGEVEASDPIWTFLEDHSDWKRVVAFKVDIPPSSAR
jgi:hypothetical protein